MKVHAWHPEGRAFHNRKSSCSGGGQQSLYSSRAEDHGETTTCTGLRAPCRSRGGPRALCEPRHTDGTPLNAACVIQEACIRMGTRSFDLCELRHTDATPLNAASVIQGACIRMGTRSRWFMVHYGCYVSFLGLA